MTNYRRGADQERRAKKRLEEMGAVLVIRSAGSHTPVDLTAFWAAPKPPWLIQASIAKRGKSRRERMELVDLAHDVGAVPVLLERGMRWTVLGEAA